MDKKSKAKRQQAEEKRKRSEVMKSESAKDINQRFRDGILWSKDKTKK